MTVGRSRTAASTAWRLLAAALALAGAVCLALWADGSAPGPASVPAAGTLAASASAASASAASGPASGDPTTVVTAPPASRQPKPLRLSIPSLDLSTRLDRLGLQADGTVEVPADPDLAGWYRLGPPPGGHGSAVILGHVDSADGPAVFAHLADLGTGARVVVALDDGTSVTFAVHAVRTFQNEDFPAERVYGRQGRRLLKLVTCGGEYDARRGGYQANVVVSARWVNGTRS